MSFSLVRLGDICDLKNGYAFRSQDYVDKSNTLSCRMSNIRPGGIFDIDYNPRFLPDDFAEKYSEFLLGNNDVVIAMTDLADSPKILGVPTVIKTDNKNILLNQRVGKLVIKDSNKVHFPYLKLVLNYPKTRTIYKKFAGGGLQINLGKTDLLSIEIPLPPLPEQKRIAAILDKADAIRRKRQQAIQLADQFLRAAFLDMFGDPVTNPKGWDLKPILSGVNNIESGWSAKGSNFPCPPGEVGVLKISAVTSGKFKPQENKFVEHDSIPSNKKLIFPNKGDLLFSRANTRELVAATVIVNENRSDVFLPDKLWRISLNKEILLPEFLHYLILMPKFRGLLTSQATGTSGSMLNISKSKFESTLAIFPPIERQLKFSSQYWKCQSIQSINKTLVHSSDNIFGSLSQKAFSGKL